jgi:D-alanine-D-alanine ligase
MHSGVKTPARVVVLMGGRSAEREVSLNTGAQVAEALASRGHEVLTVDSARPDFIVAIQDEAPDVVFICLHGRLGEDGTVQGLFELLDTPYVGSGVLASALATDKVMTKFLYIAHGIPTPDYVVLRRGEDPDEAALAALGDRTVVKPACEGSSIGMSIVHDPSELPAAIVKAFEHDDRVLVERFVDGVEVTVGVLGNGDEAFALPTLQVVPVHEFYDYESKYVPGMSRHVIPADVSEAARAGCQLAALAAHKALGCAGVSRTDTIVTPEGEVLVLETNTIPGMTATSLLPDSARAAGIEFPELCERLIGYALEGWATRSRV